MHYFERTVIIVYLLMSLNVINIDMWICINIQSKFEYIFSNGNY